MIKINSKLVIGCLVVVALLVISSIIGIIKFALELIALICIYYTLEFFGVFKVFNKFLKK